VRDGPEDIGARMNTFDTREPRWIRSYALLPRRLTDGSLVWLQPYEWRWRRLMTGAPSAVTPPTLEARRVTGSAPAGLASPDGVGLG
jgi:hypothetical protein